jgi:hypothetical protein
MSITENFFRQAIPFHPRKLHTGKWEYVHCYVLNKCLVDRRLYREAR